MNQKLDNAIISIIIAFSVIMIPVGIYLDESLLIVLSILNVIIGLGCLRLSRNNSVITQ